MSSLEDKINKKIEEGYELHGFIKIETMRLGMASAEIYCQSVIFKEKSSCES